MDPLDMDTLRQLNEDYVRSVQACDGAWFEAHLDRDFVNSGPDCLLEDRASFIERVARPAPVSDLRAEDVTIQPLAGVAIIRAKTRYSKADGSAGSGCYTDVWVRRDGRWLCVCADVTRH